MSSKKYGSQFLKGLREYRVASGVESEVMHEFLQALDCPRALTVSILLRNKEFAQLSGLEFNPLHYRDVVHCRDSYAATKFLSKYPGFSRELDLAKVALEKFERFELLCASTNHRFRDLAADPLYNGSAVWLHHAITRKIAKILGDFDLGEFFCMPDWGPGATTLMKRRDASSVNKFQCETGITRDLFSRLPLDVLKAEYPLWGDRLNLSGYPTFQVGNRVTTVPKDSSTDRVIAIEPGLNLFFQSSIGDMIRRRLVRCGIDLRRQDRNQSLARVGSKFSTLATVDMSSASDSISIEVVRELLPPDWFEWMDLCRSHFGQQGTTVKKWEKFSSMGNGFTFQLESLIFYAISLCCAEYENLETNQVSVYGDDIIVPVSSFAKLTEVMSFYGFLVNTKKSHFDSPFRESCGAHYYSGIDVKPIYLKEKLSTIQSVYRLANAIRRMSHRRCCYLACDSAFYRVHHLIFSLVPKALRLMIPEELGDGGFVGSFDEAVPERVRHGVEGYHVYHVMDIGLTYLDEREGYLLASLWAGYKSSRLELLKTSALVCEQCFYTLLPSGRTVLETIHHVVGTPPKANDAGKNRVVTPGRTAPRVVKSTVQRWGDFGPWL